MGVRQRQERGGDYRNISGRLPEPQYAILVELAWSKRMSLSYLVSTLLNKAVKAEDGEPYIPGVQPENSAAQ